MGAPYSGTSVSGYNANPPPDDGTTVATNQITWAGIKSKVGDPLNTFASSVDSNITSAVGKIVGGASVVSTAVNYAMTAADQGRLIRATASGITITTPDATVVKTPFAFRIINNSSGSITLAGNGSQNVDGQNTQSVAAGAGALVDTDGTNWFTDGLSPAQQFMAVLPQGYLTLASDTVNIVPSSDVTSATSVFYSPDTGNLCPIYNGTNTILQSFAQQTLTLVANHLASTIYDVFAFMNSGVFTIGTGPAWNNSGAGTGARGTGGGTTELQRTNGILTNKNIMTLRNGATTYSNIAAGQCTYLGSIFIDSVAGQITCHVSYGQSRKWGVWSAYNRRPIRLKAGDSTANWTIGTGPRAANNNSANSLTTFTGLAEEQLDLKMIVHTRMQFSGSAQDSVTEMGIGYNSTTAFSGIAGFLGYQTPTISGGTAQIEGNNVANFLAVPALGINTVTAVESLAATGGSTFSAFGTETHMLLSAQWRG